jgi:acyl carrier protein
MTREVIKSIVLRILGEIAPEADLSYIKPDVSFRDQLDIDSMDFLNFAIGVHKELGVEIPEADYPKLMTLDGCIEYLSLLVEPGRTRG